MCVLSVHIGHIYEPLSNLNILVLSNVYSANVSFHAIFRVTPGIGGEKLLFICLAMRKAMKRSSSSDILLRKIGVKTLELPYD